MSENETTVGRYAKDGCIAVLVSPDFGAGFGTWSGLKIAIDREVVEAFLTDNEDALSRVIRRKYPDAYYRGQRLELFWVPIGKRFRLHEYDGSESIEILDPYDKSWAVA